MRKTWITALVLTSMTLGNAQAQTPVDPLTTMAGKNQLFTLLSAIGAIDHCERLLGYKIAGKVDELAYRRIETLLEDGLNPDNMAERLALSEFGDRVLQYADGTGVWIVGAVVKDAAGKDASKGTPVQLDLPVCASIEAHIRKEMAPGGLIEKAGPNEPGA